MMGPQVCNGNIKKCETVNSDDEMPKLGGGVHRDIAQMKLENFNKNSKKY